MKKKYIPAYLLTFVNVLGFSILMPVLPFIVAKYGAPQWVYGLLITLYSTFQFIGAPILGSMSDQKGRKPILLISQAGTLLSWIIFLIALYIPNIYVLGVSVPIMVIAFARIFDGVTGGNNSVTHAYVADVTTRQEKSYIFGYLGGIAGLGMIIGPGLGGLAASSSLEYTGTVIVALLVSSVTLISIYAWLKESHVPATSAKKQTYSLKKTFLIVSRIREVNPGDKIKLLFLLKVIFATMMAFYIGSIALFLIDLFDFNEKELGMFMFVVGIFLSFNQAFVSKRVIAKIGEFNTLKIGLACSFIGLLCITFTDNLYLFIAFYYIMNLGLSLSFPTFNSLISIHADPSKQGEIMGISESLNSLAMALFPVVAAATYGLIQFNLYYLISAMPLLAFVIAVMKGKKVGL